MQNRNNELLPYMVGGLLYTPSINSAIVEKILKRKIPCLTSVAFCLEDTIEDDALEGAETELKKSLTAMKKGNINKEELPLLFIRIRTPWHMEHVHKLLGSVEELITGYILPKFDLSNASEYADLIKGYNKERKSALYIMPTLESKSIAMTATRADVLIQLKEIIDTVPEYVLNVRVGGNDFCNLFGLRRTVGQSIYDIGIIRDILVDINNVFASDYVVSGPVWEYFGENPTDEWALGLNAELKLDRNNGFIGKTAIHPSQLPLIYESLKVSNTDFLDAIKILNWPAGKLGVAKSEGGSRMNEVKCHKKWAMRVEALSRIYGIREEQDT